MRIPRWYWWSFNALPVTFHLKRDRLFHWQRIRGVQVGPWFFGAIRGTSVDAVDPPVGSTGKLTTREKKNAN